MKFLKENFVKIGIILLLLERIYYYAFANPKLFSFLNFIIEHVLELSR